MSWAVSAACILVGLLPVVVAGTAGDVDVDRIAGDIEAIAQIPHPMGSPANAAVHSYLLATLSADGLEPQSQRFLADDYFGAPGAKVDAANVVARIAGRDDRALLLVAHYDSVPTTPGANDNAAAVAALLEVSRLLVGTVPPNDVIVLFTDGEEPAPKYGATAFATHEWFADVALVANFEATGAAGPSLLVETSDPRGQLVAHLTLATDPVAFSFISDVTDLMGDIGTDFDVFRSEGIPGYNFAYIRGSSIYHTPRDDVGSLSLSGAADHASIALGLARQPIPTFEADIEDPAVFFTLPGGIVVRFGAGFALAAAIGAVVFAAFVTVLRLRRRRTTPRSVLMGVAWTLGGMLVAALVGTLTWMGVTTVRPEMRALEGYGWLVLLVGVAAVVSWLADRRREDGVTGVLLVWAGLAAVSAIPLPGFATFFAIPAIVACAAALSAEYEGGTVHQAVRVVGVSIVTAMMVVPALDTFFLLATPRPGNPDSELASVVILPVALAFLIIELIGTTMNPPPTQPTPPDLSVGQPQPAALD